MENKEDDEIKRYLAAKGIETYEAGLTAQEILDSL